MVKDDRIIKIPMAVPVPPMKMRYAMAIPEAMAAGTAPKVKAAVLRIMVRVSKRTPSAIFTGNDMTMVTINPIKKPLMSFPRWVSRKRVR